MSLHVKRLTCQDMSIAALWAELVLAWHGKREYVWRALQAHEDTQCTSKSGEYMWERCGRVVGDLWMSHEKVAGELWGSCAIAVGLSWIASLTRFARELRSHHGTWELCSAQFSYGWSLVLLGKAKSNCIGWSRRKIFQQDSSTRNW